VAVPPRVRPTRTPSYRPPSTGALLVYHGLRGRASQGMAFREGHAGKAFKEGRLGKGVWGSVFREGS